MRTAAPAARIAVEEALLALDPAWTIRAGAQLGEPPEDAATDYLLLHPRKGIALVDVGGGHGDAGAALRDFLARQGFGSFFPGTLPIVHVVIGAGPVALAARLDAAFAAVPALTIVEPDWAAAVRFLVAAVQSPDRSPVPHRADPEPTVEPQFATPAWSAGPDLAMPSGQLVATAPADGADGEAAVEPIAAAPRRWPAAMAALALLGLVGGAAAWHEWSAKPPRVIALELPLPSSKPMQPGRAAAPPATLALRPATTGHGVPAVLPPAHARAAPRPLGATPAPVPAAAIAPPPLPARKPVMSAATAPTEHARAPIPQRKPTLVAAARPAAVPRPVRKPRRTLALAELAAAQPARPPGRDCRIYDAPLSVLGTRQPVTGLACQSSDGTWQIVSEMPR